MKTIATAVILMVFATTAWADEPEAPQTNDPANTGGPIVLSDAAMDGVSAGGGMVGSKTWSAIGAATTAANSTDRTFDSEVSVQYARFF